MFVDDLEVGVDDVGLLFGLRLGPGVLRRGRSPGAALGGPGGRLRFATDWAEYADWTLERALKTPSLTWTAERADDWRIPPADHATTRYEQKKLGDCEPVFLEFVRG